VSCTTPITPAESWQHAQVKFPIIADVYRKVSELYDLIHPNASSTATVRSPFIIDPSK
jgi:alkyl hydroperoxide reductase subunit AhpC